MTTRWAPVLLLSMLMLAACAPDDGSGVMFGTDDADDRALAAIEDDPVKFVIPPGARLQSEESFVESSISVERTYCSELAGRETLAFYERELPERGWERRDDLDGPQSVWFEKEVADRLVELEVRMHPGAKTKCDKFFVTLFADY